MGKKSLRYTDTTTYYLSCGLVSALLKSLHFSPKNSAVNFHTEVPNYFFPLFFSCQWCGDKYTIEELLWSYNSPTVQCTNITYHHIGPQLRERAQQTQACARPAKALLACPQYIAERPVEQTTCGHLNRFIFDSRDLVITYHHHHFGPQLRACTQQTQACACPAKALLTCPQHQRDLLTVERCWPHALLCGCIKW